MSLLSLELDGKGRFLYKPLEVCVLELMYDQHRECVMYLLLHFGCIKVGNGYIVDGHTRFT